MNQKIKDLYARAVSNRFPEGEEEVYMSPADLGKFAELIVRESADISSLWQMGDHPGFLVKTVILTHFGVKE